MSFCVPGLEIICYVKEHNLKYRCIKNMHNTFFSIIRIVIIVCSVLPAVAQTGNTNELTRECILINDGWKFYKYDSLRHVDDLIYDVRPEVVNSQEVIPADARPTEATKVSADKTILKPWILPSANKFIKDPARGFTRPAGNPGATFPFVQNNFDDNSWECVDLPHDWAIKGPFMKGLNPEVGGGMGRLPVNGVAWYRKKLNIPLSDTGRNFFLDIDGAMSYAMVWCNGQLAGGWPYGYNSWRVDLTPFIKTGGINQLAIRLDNPNNSSRWYPGGGIYRNVWLIKTNSIHVGHWGTFIKTRDISNSSAVIDMAVTIDNNSEADATVKVRNEIFVLDDKLIKAGEAVSRFTSYNIKVVAGESAMVEDSVLLKDPRLWGPPPTQKPNLYVAVTTLLLNGKAIDRYETRFGIRSL